MSFDGYQPLPLKPFQADAVDALVASFKRTEALTARAAGARRTIARQGGVTLLVAPTGSGKTLAMGRALERATQELDRPCVWFWFAPYTGLIAQTRLALAAQCPGLVLRDVATDRDPTRSAGGHVWLSTWAAVATRQQAARRARTEGETQPSLDTMIARLRGDGFAIGVVVDEAHVNFGTTAEVAADFYETVLEPDYTLLATATPNDARLTAFATKAGLTHINRITVAREDVVAARLNKPVVQAIHFAPTADSQDLLDPTEVALALAWRRHKQVKERLAARGVPVTPLMLVQVDNRSPAAGEADPVQAARAILEDRLQVSAQRIAVHTADQPDPAFHTLAIDEEREVLIFKLAAATGFDAPRAWTLVSLRPSQGVGFGLQLLGRIMRVHPRVQRLEPPDPLLDTGTVVLAAADQQAGLQQAAGVLNALESEIATVSDRLAIWQVAQGMAVGDPAHGLLGQAALESALGLARRTDAVDPTTDTEDPVAAMPWDAAVGVDATPTDLGALADGGLDLFGHPAGAPAVPPARRRDPAARTPGHRYPLRTDCGCPTRLFRESFPGAPPLDLDTEVARAFALDDGVLTLVNRVSGRAMVTTADIFGDGSDPVPTEEAVPLSPALIHQKAEQALRRAAHVNQRQFRPALLARLRQRLADIGWPPQTESDLRRAVDMILLRYPTRLEEAARQVLATVVQVEQGDPLPDALASQTPLIAAPRNVYGVMPAGLNGPEWAFAQRLERSEVVLWWLRNVENTRWAVRVLLTDGHYYFPDFVVGVRGRRSEDGPRLVEVKDDGETGRALSHRNTLKRRSRHQRYGSVLMVFQDRDGRFINWVYAADRDRLVEGTLFEEADLISRE